MNGIYPGVREGVNDLFGYYPSIAATGVPVGLLRAFDILDLPFSFALDTFCVPYDIFNNWEEKIYISFPTGFDKVNSIVSFSAQNKTNKKLSVKVDISVKEMWMDYHKNIPQTDIIGRKTANIVLPLKSTTVFEEYVECNPKASEVLPGRSWGQGRDFHTSVSIISYQKVK
jgi:hypothetical protein